MVARSVAATPAIDAYSTLWPTWSAFVRATCQWWSVGVQSTPQVSVKAPTTTPK